MSFKDASARLEKILTRLEDDDVDIDAISRSVEEAERLVTLCREKIRAAGMQLEQVCARLDIEVTSTTDDGDDDDDDDDPE